MQMVLTAKKKKVAQSPLKMFKSKKNFSEPCG